MKREYPERPIVGVGMVVIEDNRIVLVKRERDPGKGRWSIPGGLLELGESVQDGAKREVREEIGLNVEIDCLIDVEENIARDKNDRIRYHYVLIDFLGHPIGGLLKPDTDVRDARWVDLKDLDKYIITNTLKRLLKKANLLDL